MEHTATPMMAAVMSCEMSNTDNIIEYLEESKKMGIEVLPPQVNLSVKGFSVKDGKISYGLEAVKGIGGKVVDAIIDSRDQDGEFRSLFDLCERVEGKAINKSVLESLISCGALDSLGPRRSQLFSVIEQAIHRGSERRKDRERGQTTLFEIFGDPSEGGTSTPDSNGSNGTADGVYPDVAEWSDEERLSREKKSLGFYLTGHPLLRWKDMVNKYASLQISDVANQPNGTAVVLGVQISKLTKKVSKKTGDPFWIALIEDLNGSLEIFINKDIHETAKESLQEENLVFLKGSIRYRDTTPSFRLDKVIPFQDAPAILTKDLSVVIPLDGGDTAEDLIFRFKDICQGHRGKCPVYLIFTNASGERAIVLVGSKSFVAPNTEFLTAVDSLCGANRVFVNKMGKASF